jgi:hypothetical protein
MSHALSLVAPPSVGNAFAFVLSERRNGSRCSDSTRRRTGDHRGRPTAAAAARTPATLRHRTERVHQAHVHVVRSLVVVVTVWKFCTSPP